MMFDLEKELLIICNNEVKEKILRKAFDEKRLFSYTFLSMNALKEKLFFKISTEAYLYAAEFLKCSYANSKIITPSIYYVDVNEVYEDSKLIQLQSLKKELIENDLLEFDMLFETFLTRKKVYIYKEEFDNFTLNMIEKIKQLTDVSFFTFDDHFSFDETVQRKIITSVFRIDAVHQNVKVGDQSEEEKFNTYRKEVSDHIPVVVEIDFR